MASSISQKELGQRLFLMRKHKGYSQEDVAKILGTSRATVAQTELGLRKVSIQELIKLSEALGFSFDKILSDHFAIENDLIEVRNDKTETERIRISVPKLKIEKFRNILLYILERCAGKPNIGETVLYKLLYFSDFNYYELYEEQLTGAEYRKLHYGPVPQKLDIIINQMIRDKQIERFISDYHGYPQTRYIPLVKVNLLKLKASEKEVIDRVLDLYSDWNAIKLSDYSHNDVPWKATEEGEVIDYELAFYREQPYSVRNYENENENE